MKTLPIALVLTATLAATAIAPPLAIARTTDIASIERGAVVTLSGTVDRIADEDEFVLRDASGTVLIYVGPTRVPVELGEVVTVQGTVDDDVTPEVYATQITRADGRVVALPQYDH